MSILLAAERIDWPGAIAVSVSALSVAAIVIACLIVNR